jgi:tRNA (guanine-N7-)-methyltransferase
VVELIPDSYVTRLDLETIFGRTAPLQVDLGCGDGSFISALARQVPEHDFLGIERLVGRVRSTARKAAKMDNVRVLRIETSYAVRYLLPARSVSVFHLLFPDPWPKRKHQRRRLVTDDFLSGIATALVEDGSFRVATDQPDYFEYIESLTNRSSDFQIAPGHGRDELPRTTFERKFVDAGARIYRLELRKISPVT